ncbi:MAG: uracil-DNA glycosylase [Armatimonadetes bacterium]|nr:uracil-DNA glycosylase [Armatimonadota bacterium]
MKSIQQYLEYLQLSGIEDIYLKPQPDRIFSSQKLDELEKNYQDCKKCPLEEGRENFCYGNGNPKAKLMLIGEGPGADEDATGRVFVGRAGQLLTKMLKAIHLERDEVYITNIVKCRPPNNRNPLPNEINACLPYLEEQISIIQPKLLLLLGKVAASTLLNRNLSLTKFRENTYSFMGIKTYVTYHPSALLRNQGWKRPAWIDLQKLQKDYQKLD